MKVYIAGPITGIPDNNRAGFAAGEKWAAEQGWEPVNPLAIAHAHPGRRCPVGEAITDGGETHPYGCWVRADLAALLDCDAILMLRGWTRSRGAKHEHATAAICFMPIHYMPDAELVAVAS
jgi:hypothetical protein